MYNFFFVLGVELLNFEKVYATSIMNISGVICLIKWLNSGHEFPFFLAD